MPTSLFFELDPRKRENIFTAALSEFARCGYQNGSTNIIARDSGISKGSLFKYFENKEDLYFYILDRAVEDLLSSLEQRELPAELFRRVATYSEFELAWYIQHPEKYRLIISAFSRADAAVSEKVALRYSVKGMDIYRSLMEQADLSQIPWDRETVFNIIKWVLNGFNEAFIGRIQANGNTLTAQMRDEYIRSLTAHMEILKTGFLGGR